MQSAAALARRSTARIIKMYLTAIAINVLAWLAFPTNDLAPLNLVCAGFAAGLSAAEIINRKTDRAQS